MSFDSLFLVHKFARVAFWAKLFICSLALSCLEVFTGEIGPTFDNHETRSRGGHVSKLVSRSTLNSQCLLQTEPKKKLTPEEAAQAAEDLRKKIKAKNQVTCRWLVSCGCQYHTFGAARIMGCPTHNICHVLQKEEAELEKLREKERIRSGKELLEAKRKEDDLKLKRNLEARRIEKEEEQRARDKIRVKLGQCCALQACACHLALPTSMDDCLPGTRRASSLMSSMKASSMFSTNSTKYPNICILCIGYT